MVGRAITSEPRNMDWRGQVGAADEDEMTGGRPCVTGMLEGICEALCSGALGHVDGTSCKRAERSLKAERPLKLGTADDKPEVASTCRV